MRLRPANPMTRVLAVLLVFEAIDFGLAIAAMIQVVRIEPGIAFGLAGAAALMAVAAAALLRTTAGWVLAWGTQVAGVAMGFAVDMMFWLGGFSALLFAAAFVLGRRIEPAA